MNSGLKSHCKGGKDGQQIAVTTGPGQVFRRISSIIGNLQVGMVLQQQLHQCLIVPTCCSAH